MDAAVQTLRRRAKEDPEAKARLMQAGLRAGKIDENLLQTLVILGDPAAALLLPELAAEKRVAVPVDLLIAMEVMDRQLQGEVMLHVSWRVLRSKQRSGMWGLASLDSCFRVLRLVRRLLDTPPPNTTRLELCEALRFERNTLRRHFEDDVLGRLHGHVILMCNYLSCWAGSVIPSDHASGLAGFVSTLPYFTQPKHRNRWVRDAIFNATLGTVRRGR